MSKIEWQNLFSLEIESVDQQHKKMIEIINHLDDILHKSKEIDDSEIESLLLELKDYTEYHFSEEERIQDEIHYYDKVRHKEIHRNLTEKVNTIYNDFRRNQKIDGINLMNFLSDWLVQHILNEDKKIGIEYKKFKAKEQPVN